MQNHADKDKGKEGERGDRLLKRPFEQREVFRKTAARPPRRTLSVETVLKYKVCPIAPPSRARRRVVAWNWSGYVKNPKLNDDWLAQDYLRSRKLARPTIMST